MDEVTVRRARPFDAGPMARLLERIVAPGRTGTGIAPMTGADLLDWMTDDTLWHLAERSGEIVGFQWVEPHPGLPRTTCDIATFIAPEERDIGPGTRLFDRTRKVARAAGFTHVQARVRGTNDGGLIYYQSRGFERLTPRPDPASGRPPVQTVTMTYRL